MSKITVYIPLCAGERILIERAASESGAILQSPNSERDDIEPFELWIWTHSCKEIFEEFLELDSFQEEAQGNVAKAYSLILNEISHREKPLANSTFRARLIEEDNPDFLQRYHGRTFKDIQFLPCQRDEKAWRALRTVLLSDALSYLPRPDSMRSDCFDIWKLTRVSRVLMGNRKSTDIFFSLTKTPQFRDMYCFDLKDENDVAEVDEESELLDEEEDLIEEDMHLEDSGEAIQDEDPLLSFPVIPNLEYLSEVLCRDDDMADLDLDYTKSEWRLLDLRSLSKQTPWPGNEPKQHTNGDFTRDYIRWLYQTPLLRKHLPNPFALVHCIDWEDLRRDSLDMKHLKNKISQRNPGIESTLEKEWWLWRHEDYMSLWAHHLHPEEEVYWYCIENDWSLPGLVDDEQIVFVATAIEQTTFLETLEDFWEIWSDCALTKRPSDGQLFLLETLPGIQYRERRNRQDDQAAIRFFRNAVESRHQSALELRQTLRDTIGANNFRPEYNGLLRLLPTDQMDLAESSFLGEGSNGRVITAMWSRPAGELATSGWEVTRIPVALKEVLPTVSRSGDAFIRELSNTYTAVSGRHTGCIIFHGITSLQIPNHDAQLNHLFLVFERATEGPLLPHLANRLLGSDLWKGWDIVIETLCNIIVGLETLHQHGVIHRDLHSNNVLVTHRPLPVAILPAQKSTEYTALVTDIGEGKILLEPQTDNTSAFVPSKSAGAAHFGAPEVRGSTGWTKKADVYSFGMLSGRILDLWSGILSAKDDENSKVQAVSDVTMPVIIKEVLTSSLEEDPASRAETATLTAKLNNLRSDFYDESQLREGRVDWVCWDWREALRADGPTATGVSRGDSDMVTIEARYLS